MQERKTFKSFPFLQRKTFNGQSSLSERKKTYQWEGKVIWTEEARLLENQDHVEGKHFNDERAYARRKAFQ